MSFSRQFFFYLGSNENQKIKIKNDSNKNLYQDEDIIYIVCCEAPVILEIWGMRSTLSLSSLPGPLWPGVRAPDRVLSIVQIEVSDTAYLC